MKSGDGPEGDVVMDNPQPCAICGDTAHIVMKDGRRLCARHFRDEKRSEVAKG